MVHSVNLLVALTAQPETILPDIPVKAKIGRVGRPICEGLHHQAGRGTLGGDGEEGDPAEEQIGGAWRRRRNRYM